MNFESDGVLYDKYKVDNRIPQFIKVPLFSDF